MGGESEQGWDDIFIAVDGGCRAVLGGWPAAAVRIQCFSFILRGDATGRTIAERWSGGNELILALWEESVIQRGGVATSIGGEAAPRREKEEDDASWTNVNFTRPKNKKIHTVNSVATNGQ
jgi:hypothetical protein